MEIYVRSLLGCWWFRVAGEDRGVGECSGSGGSGGGADPALAAVGEENENGEAGEVREDLRGGKGVRIDGSGGSKVVMLRLRLTAVFYLSIFSQILPPMKLTMLPA